MIKNSGFIGFLNNFNATNIIYTFLLLFFLKVLLLAFFVIPQWDIPDETGHFSYIHDIATGKGLPLLRESEMSSIIGAPGRDNWIAQHPPVYHLLAVPIVKLGLVLNWDYDLLFKLPRLVSNILGTLTLLVIYNLFILFRMTALVSLSVTILVASIPMFSILSAGGGNDITMIFFSALSIYFWAKFLLYSEIVDAYKSMLWISIAISTKMTALVIAAPMLAIVIYELEFSRTWIRHVIGLIVSTLFIPSFWMIRQFIYFGDPFATNASLRLAGRLPRHQDSFFEYITTLPVLDQYFINFFGLFGWMGQERAEYLIQISDYPLQVISLITVMFVGIALGIMLYKSLKNVISSHHYSSLKFKSLSEVVYHMIDRIGLTRYLGYFVILFAISMIFLTYEYIYMRDGGELRQIVFASLAGLVLLSLGVFIRPLKKRDKIVAYSFIIIGFFTAILLWKAYGIYILDGRLKAIHGRYFFHLIPLILIGLIIPMSEVLNKMQNWFVLIGLIAIYIELLTFFEEVIPHFRGGLV